jgi:hypothetical protein
VFAFRILPAISFASGVGCGHDRRKLIATSIEGSAAVKDFLDDEFARLPI